jgi:hypothetical protein
MSAPSLNECAANVLTNRLTRRFFARTRRRRQSIAQRASSAFRGSRTTTCGICSQPSGIAIPAVSRRLQIDRARSGVIEKNIEVQIARRFKRQGRSWTRPGAEHLLQWSFTSVVCKRLPLHGQERRPSNGRRRELLYAFNASGAAKAKDVNVGAFRDKVETRRRRRTPALPHIQQFISTRCRRIERSKSKRIEARCRTSIWYCPRFREILAHSYQ